MAVKVSQYFTLYFDGQSLGKLKSMSLKIDGKEIQTSNFNTTITNEYLKGRNDVMIEFTSIYDQANASVDDAVDDLLSNLDGIDISLQPYTPDTGDITYTCQGFPINANWDFNDDDRPEISSSFRINSLIKGTDGSGLPFTIPFIIS